MKITFRRVDEEYYGVEEFIKPIVDVTISYDLFICIVCEILNLCDSYNEHIVKDVKDSLKLFEYRLDENNQKMFSDYSRLSSLIEKFYWNIVGDDFGGKIKAFNEKQYWHDGLRYADGRLGRYRGLLLEELVIAVVKDRFSDKLFCTGCQIYINRGRIIAHYGEGNALHKETIDIAGWADSSKYGEFYECKVNPKRFENENYKYFMELINILNGNGIKNYKIGLVSADAGEHLKAQKKYLEEKDDECKAEFELIGREDIYNMHNYAIPEIA